MSDTKEISRLLWEARRHIAKAHGRADTWSNGMSSTVGAIDELGLGHIRTAGEDTPDRILNAQARAMAELTFVYAEKAHETDELTFVDEVDEEKFEEYLDKGHDTAQRARQLAENDE